ncbi:MAG: D-inositol-3-phosphate glycosyltransferase [Gammaproteobacteria bacterium]|nr:D-inositol-3-phosphate glycosyltransferase [Gammaproteobacteria bacterium]
MRISWLSNSPWARTGYGNQTMLFVPRLQKLGHEMQISAFYGLEGGVLNLGGIPVYPRGYHPYGQDVMSAHAMHFKADLLISLIDAWVMNPQQVLGGLRWAAWFPIDHDPVPQPVLMQVQKAWARIVYSRFAECQMKNAGLDCYYVPHGVDTSVFRPIDRVEARDKTGWPQDKFIVGMVAANKGQPSRKAFAENIRAFCELKRKRSDMMLYLHTVAGTENDGMNLPGYIESLGMSFGFVGSCDPKTVDVLFSDQYAQLIGIPDDYMNTVYNAMDVHLLVSMGEGFGIPLVEAQAAGTPVIVGDWTAMPELCFSGWKVYRSEAEPFWTPINSYQFLPHAGAIADRLEAAYQMRDNQDYRERARDGALAYDADKVTEKYWKPVLEDMAERIEMWKPQEQLAIPAEAVHDHR